MKTWRQNRRLLRWWRFGWLAATVSLFLFLAGWQLGLPGLHYDEAKEAGVNAMELLHGAPVTAFRGATVPLFGRALPLMVQDYIGALNVYLAVPVLALTGVGVPNLRLLALLWAVLGLLALERALSEWVAFVSGSSAVATRISGAALGALALLAAGPSFVFWQRQGIFVTNATLPLTFACLWLGIRWLRLGRAQHLLLAAFCGGLALYAKLLAGWIVLPFALLAGGWWLWQTSRPGRSTRPLPALSPALAAGTLLAFLLPLLPFFLFNLQTGGTVAAVAGNLGRSYYGVDNSEIWTNAAVRMGQLGQALSGGHFWYLGGIHRNPAAVWLALAFVTGGLLWPGGPGRRLLAGPLLLLGLAFAASLFTVSDLFVTHYALVHPLAVAVAGLGLYALWRSAERARPLLILLACGWLLLDLRAVAGYHTALAGSGGLGDHSDATYHLAFDLRYGGLGAPIALDWGLDAPVRFLSEGTVTPIEIFGYDSLAQPDGAFAQRLAPFLQNPGNVYLLRAPGQEIFQGRRAVLEELAGQVSGRLQLEKVYTQRDGTPLFERWRVSK